MTDQIDFHAVDDETVVIRSRQGIAIYENNNGDVVIRQDGGMDDDAIIVVSRSDLADLILALENA